MLMVIIISSSICWTFQLYALIAIAIKRHTGKSFIVDPPPYLGWDIGRCLLSHNLYLYWLITNTPSPDCRNVLLGIRTLGTNQRPQKLRWSILLRQASIYGSIFQLTYRGDPFYDDCLGCWVEYRYDIGDLFEAHIKREWYGTPCG